MQEQATVIALTFAAYLAVVLLLGYLAWRRRRDLADFILGGRSLGPRVTAFSAQASDMSAWLLMALPGLAYAAGFQAAWLALGLVAGTYVNWKLVAAPLSQETERLGDALTLPDYFARRFRDHALLLRTLPALVILVFFTFYASSGFVAAARLFQTLFGLDYGVALALGALAVLIYTFCGGFLAISWAGMVQGSLMFMALVVVAAAGVRLNGGFGGIGDTVGAYNPALLSPWLQPDGRALGAIGIASLLGWGLGHPGQPHVLARFTAIRRPEELTLARKVAMGWVVAVLAAAILVGYAGIGVLERSLADAETEKVFIYLSLQLFPPALAGICLSAILAAVMSTTAAQLLVASSAFVQGNHLGFLRLGSGGRSLLGLDRMSVAAVAALAYLMALNPQSTVLALVARAWAGFGAAFGPPLLLSLHWPRMRSVGALAGMGAGSLTVLVWGALQGGWFDMYELLPGFTASTLAAVLVSRIADFHEARTTKT